MRIPSMLRPSMPHFNFRNNLAFAVIIFWIFGLVWLWIWGADYTISGIKPFASLAVRWLITILMITAAMCFAIWKMLKQIKRLRAMQKRRRKDKVIHEDEQIVAQKSYLSRWLTRLQKQLGAKNFVYQRPWYLVIGNSDSGKSTLLKENCRLDELYDAEIDKNNLFVNCWLNEQAIIFDANGLLFDQPEAESPKIYSKLWHNLLEWLVATRERQPINGVILTIDVHQIATFNKAELTNYVSVLKNRLDEVSKILHCHLPIYFVFTKLDLLYGFEAMYQTLEPAERQEVLGATFSQNSKWEEELTTFWDQWIAQINSAMATMMLNDVDVSQRSHLFSFSRQVNGIKNFVSNVVDKSVFSLNNNTFIVRGVYLTSSIQQGRMEDLFVKAAASHYKLPEPMYPTWQVSMQSSFFSNKLLNEYIFSENDIASENLLYARLKKRHIYTYGIGTLAAIGLMTIAWQHYFHVNNKAGETVLTKSREFMDTHIPNQLDLFGDKQLPLLNPISEAMFAYGNYHKRRKLADMGLYQGRKVGPHIEKTYLDLLQQRFLTAVMSGLQVEMNRAPKESNAKLRALRIMRMLEDESGRSNKMVMQHMSETWSNYFKGQKTLQKQLEGHLQYAIEHIDWKKNRQNGNLIAVNSYLPFDQSIKDAQVELRRIPIYQRVYQNLFHLSRNVLPTDLNIQTQIGANFNDVFAVDDEKTLNIPQMLTKSGLSNYFILQDEKLIDHTALDSWVLDITKKVVYSEEDRRGIQRDITQLYMSDFTSAWNNAYESMHIRKFDSIPQAVTAVEHIALGEQIFGRALQLLRDNTDPQSDAAREKQENPDETPALPIPTSDVLASKQFQLLNQINREFIKATSVLNKENEQTSALQNVIIRVGELHRYLLTIQNSPSPGKAALQAVKLRFNNQGIDPIIEIQQMGKTLPNPLGRWLTELSSEIWDLIMVEALKSLEVEWNRNVISFYNQNLAGRYPFNSKSMQDVPLSTFERFFGANGILDMFYEENLRIFIENSGTGKSLIRSDVLRQLEHGRKISTTFFSREGIGARYSIQPLAMSGSRKRGILNLDGQLVEFRHSSSNPVSLIWPNSMRENIESKLTLIDSALRSNKSLTYNGPWGQIRLINAGKLTNVQNNFFDTRYDIDGGYITYRIYIDESANPFAGGLFSKFTLSPTLY